MTALGTHPPLTASWFVRNGHCLPRHGGRAGVRPDVLHDADDARSRAGL